MCEGCWCESFGSLQGEKREASFVSCRKPNVKIYSFTKNTLKKKSILDKVWTEVDKERAIDKVMHRLREKKKRTGEKQPKSKGPKYGGMVRGANNNDHSPHVEPGFNSTWPIGDEE